MTSIVTRGVIFGLLALALAGATPAAASSFEVERREVAVWRTVHAEVRADERLAARARIAGVLREVRVDEGDRVEEGEVLAWVEDPELAARIAAAEAEVSRAAAGDRQARRDLARARTLFAANDLSRARLDEVIRRAAEAENGLAAARAEVRRLGVRRERGEVLAPGAGPVIEVGAEVGSAVRPGSVVARVAVGEARLRLAVPERHLPHLQAAGRIRVVSAGAAQDVTQEVTLVQIYPDVVAGRIEADARLPAGVAPVPVGRRIAVRLQVDTVEQLSVPRELVERRHGLAFVHRRDGGRTLVQLGRMHGDRVAVLAGLEEGDVLEAP